MTQTFGNLCEVVRTCAQVYSRGIVGESPAEDQRASAVLHGPGLHGDSDGQSTCGRLDPDQVTCLMNLQCLPDQKQNVTGVLWEDPDPGSVV